MVIGGLMAGSNCVNWLFGRGLSIGCNLGWSVPRSWSDFGREEKIARIKKELLREMDRPRVDCAVIRNLLGLVAEQSRQGWCHRFITTNWDYLLQREISKLNLPCLPPCLANSQVFHLNGTVANLPDNSNRSPFLLEEDPGSRRMKSPEANIVYNQMIWDKKFVVVGMSLECETDRFLLKALGRVEDETPIGESSWVIVNPDESALLASCGRIQNALIRASVSPVCATLDDWLRTGPQELVEWGVLTS